jgi:hypothetical protein
MKMLTLLAAVAVSVTATVRADDSCASMIKHTEAAERALSTTSGARKVSKTGLGTATRDLEVAAKAARECHDRDAKLHMRAVHDLLSSALLAASDTERSRN